MNTTSSASTARLARGRTALSPAAVARHALVIIAGAAIIALAAQIAIPFKPVPITMQTLAVVLVGWGMGAGRGLGAAALYGLLGSAGLPIFAAGSAGVGPSTGYVIGFVLASAFVGWMVAREPLQGWRAFAVFGIGLAIPYIPGLIWLSAMTGMGAPWSFPVLSVGLLPFLSGDAVKLVAATALATGWAAWRNRRD